MTIGQWKSRPACPPTAVAIGEGSTNSQIRVNNRKGSRGCQPRPLNRVRLSSVHSGFVAHLRSAWIRGAEKSKSKVHRGNKKMGKEGWVGRKLVPDSEGRRFAQFASRIFFSLLVSSCLTFSSSLSFFFFLLSCLSLFLPQTTTRTPTTHNLHNECPDYHESLWCSARKLTSLTPE